MSHDPFANIPHCQWCDKPWTEIAFFEESTQNVVIRRWVLFCCVKCADTVVADYFSRNISIKEAICMQVMDYADVIWWDGDKNILDV